LLASGTLAIPQWEQLDRWAGLILAAVGLLLVGVGLMTFMVRTRNLPFGRKYAFWRNLIEFVARFWWRLRQVGPCRIPCEGPVIFTANHVCPIDPLLVYATCNYRHISFMIAAEYYRIPLAWRVVHTARCIPVRRGENDVKATKTAIRRLRDGEALGIFIQGGIRNREQADQLKNGVAMLALRTGAQVVPAHISGVEERATMLRSFLARHKARITYGPPVDLSEFSGRKGQEALAAATDKIFAAINALAPYNGKRGE
jgi:1-acyl-sn-glycerol-3-phosphate acyltransferase